MIYRLFYLHGSSNLASLGDLTIDYDRRRACGYTFYDFYEASLLGPVLQVDQSTKDAEGPVATLLRLLQLLPRRL